MVLASYALAVLSAFFAFGTIAWQTPFVGIIGSLGGHLPGWLVILAGVGLGTGTVAFLQDPSTGLAIAVVLSTLSVAVGLKVIVDQRAALRSVDLAAQPIDFFRPFLRSAPGPDEVITYGPVDGYEPHMAIYRPAPSEVAAPVVVHVHGGAWMSGDELSDARLCRYLTDHGYLVFAPTYTPATDTLPTWGLAPRQIARALATVADLRTRYGGSVDRLYLTGTSAGGNLAPLVANRIASGDSFGEADGALPRISAVALIIAATDPGLAQGNPFALIGRRARAICETYIGGTPEAVPERYEAVNAANFLDGNSPPTLLVYGPNDWLVPCQASLTYAQRARAAGVEANTFSVPWTGHLLGLNGAGGRAAAELTTRWFGSHV